ncbi:MAG: hypothetical protein QM760_02305 [Nibricoccus sp.]
MDDIIGPMTEEFFGGRIEKTDYALGVGRYEREAGVGEHGLAEACVAPGVGEFFACACVCACLPPPGDKKGEKTSARLTDRATSWSRDILWGASALKEESRRSKECEKSVSA